MSECLNALVKLFNEENRLLLRPTTSNGILSYENGTTKLYHPLHYYIYASSVTNAVSTGRSLLEKSPYVWVCDIEESINPETEESLITLRFFCEEETYNWYISQEKEKPNTLSVSL